MSDQPYFVMLKSPNGGLVPLRNENDTLAQFSDRDAAVAAAEQVPFAIAFGYIVFSELYNVAEK